MIDVVNCEAYKSAGLFDLTTDRGVVIGMGRVKIPKMPKLGFNFEIPLLSFIVIEKKKGEGFVATCIHLQIDGYGDNRERATNDMIDNVWYFLHENFSNNTDIVGAWANFYELLKSNSRTDILWDKYHALQVTLAMHGTNVDSYTELYEKIQKLEQKVQSLETTIVEKDTTIANMWDAYLSEIMSSAVVEYGGK